MKPIQIQARSFFEMLKERDTSMWEIFAQLIDGQRRELLFLDDEDKILFAYELPETLEELNRDHEVFAKEYAEKLSALN